MANPLTMNRNKTMYTAPTMPLDDDPTVAYGTRPGEIKYRSGYNPINMDLTPDMQASLDGITQDTRGYDKFAKEALRTGPSDWAKMAGAEQQALGRQARETGTADAAAGTASARAGLSMRGGLSGGARERAARSGIAARVDAGQGAMRDTRNNMMQIGMNDEEQRVNQLSMLPEMSIRQMDPAFQKATMMGTVRQDDRTHAVGERDRFTAENDKLNAFREGRFNKQMETWGNEQTANAQAEAAKRKQSGSWICAVLDRKGLMSAKEKLQMASLMLAALLKHTDWCEWYFREGKKIADHAETKPGLRWDVIKARFVTKVLEIKKTQGDLAAMQQYAIAVYTMNAKMGFPVAQMELDYAPSKLKRAVALVRMVFNPVVWGWAKDWALPQITRSVKKKLALVKL